MEMRSGSLIDLDPPPVAERRWPYYLAWALGGLVVTAVLLSRLPAGTTRPTTIAVPEALAPAAATPAYPHIVVFERGPALTPGVAVPVQILPARP